MVISICIATYNGENYINHQLESIFSSLEYANVSDYEIIISDDGSSDQTLNIINNFHNPNVIIINGPRKGLIYNFENALNYSKGDVIFLSDQDDVWMIDKVKVCIEKLKSCDLLLSSAIIVDKDLNIINESFYELNRSKLGYFNNLIKNSYLGCAITFNRKILNTALPFPKSIAMHDWWIGLIAELNFKVIHHTLPLIYYRRHSDNASNTTLPSTYSYKKRIYWRIYLFYNTIKRIYFRSIRKLVQYLLIKFYKGTIKKPYE